MCAAGSAPPRAAGGRRAEKSAAQERSGSHARASRSASMIPVKDCICLAILISLYLLPSIMDQFLQGIFSNLGSNQPEAPLPPALEMLRSIGDEQTFMRVSSFVLHLLNFCDHPAGIQVPVTILSDCKSFHLEKRGGIRKSGRWWGSG